MAIFRLLRLQNLFMVALTMYLMRWSVIGPILGVHQMELQVSEIAFLVLVLSTVLITAAGYVINDYHDAKADRINQPWRVVIDRHIGRRQALMIHVILNLAGVSAGCLYSIKYQVPWMIIIFAGVPLVLWYYSFRLKHRMLIGNFTVSLLTATVPLLVLFFEYPLLGRIYGSQVMMIGPVLRTLIFWVGMFALFAFFTNLIREITKDAEDMRGDSESGSRTVPLVIGLKKTKAILVILSLITLALLCFVFLRYLTDWISLAFLGLFLVLPFILFMTLLVKARDQADFRFLSQLMKLIMLFGLLYAPLAKWLMHRFFEL